MALQDAIDFYHSLLTPEIAQETAGQLRDQLERRGLFFGERPLSSVLRPRFFTPQQYRFLQERGRLMLTALAWRLWWRLKRHEKPEDRQLEMLRAPAFTLRARRAIDIATDGEVQRLPGPLHFRFHPDALRVLCLIAPDDGGAASAE